MPKDDAAIAAEALTDANLAGIDTHGVSRLVSYVARLQTGQLNLTPGFRLEEAAGALVFDADRALGQVGGRAAIDIAFQRAQTQAIVGMTIQRIGHLGALGFFTERLAQAGMLALLVQNGPPRMGLPGSRAPAIGNNPLAFSAPVSGGPALTFDIAASEAAYGKIIEAARSGLPIPGNWALDQSGAPTTDAKAALDGILLPAGQHKGIGLAMLVECFAGSLTGMIPRNAITPGEAVPAYFGGFLLVVNPDLIIGRAAFDAHMADWIRVYRDAGTGFRYPGERLSTVRKNRRLNGIPLSLPLYDALRALGKRVGVGLLEEHPQ